MVTEERKLLESWKEISSYLNRSVRTCRRWEASLGLPIHRLDGTPSARVFAYQDELDRWLQEKLHHVEEEGKQEAARRGRKWVFLLAGATVLAAAAVAVTLIWHPFSPVPAPSPSPTLAVLTFENQTGDISLGAWKTALPDLVITDLVQSRFVNVVKITDTLRLLVELNLADVDRFSDADLKTVAEKLGVEYVATGTLTQDGPDKVLTVLVRKPKTTDPGQTARVTFRAEKDVFAAVDALSPQIKKSLGLPKRLVSRDIDRPVSAISTASPQAFQLFSHGYRLGGLASYPECIALLKRAVELDPEFALAYRCLYRACGNADREEDMKTFRRKTLDLSRRLSDRDRDELEFQFYISLEGGKDEARALKALERLCRNYPEDRSGTVRLLGIYLKHEQWDKATPVAERAWSANKSDIDFCDRLAICYSNLGSWDRAERVLSEFIDRNPGQTDWRYAVSLRAKALTRLGKLDRALGDIDRLISNFPNDRGLNLDRGIVLLYKQDFAGAEEEFLKVLAEEDPDLKIRALTSLRGLFLMRGRIDEAAKKIRLALDISDRAAKVDRSDRTAGWHRIGLHLDLAYIQRLAGRPVEALEEVEEAQRVFEESPWRSDAPLDFLYFKALLFLDLNRWEDFERGADEIKALIEKIQTPKLMRLYYYVLGHREMKWGNYGKAVTHFSWAIDLAPANGHYELEGADPEYYYSLAQAHAGLSRGLPSDIAFSIYEKIVEPSVNRLQSEDLYARSIYEMARYYDAEEGYSGQSVEGIKANTAKAIEKYREFLDLWGGADPIFSPLVEGARKRLAALESR